MALGREANTVEFKFGDFPNASGVGRCFKHELADRRIRDAQLDYRLRVFGDVVHQIVIAKLAPLAADDVLARILLEWISIAGANDEALDEAGVEKAFAGIKLDAIDDEVAAQVEDQEFVFDPTVVSAPIAIAEKVRRRVAVEHRCIAGRKVSKTDDRLQGLNPAAALVQKGRQVDRRV